MRVLQVSGPATGGIGRHMKQLQAGLAAQGLESVVAPPVRVRPGSVAAVIAQLRRGKFDLVHCHGFQGGAVGRTAAAMCRLPAIVTIHNTLQVSGAARGCARAAEGMLRRRTSYWVAVSGYLRNYAWNVLGVPDDRTEVIVNGVDAPPELPPWHAGPVVGIVARLIPSKGVDTFLRAVQLLRPEVPELKAVVVGDGPAKHELKYLTRKLGLENTVEFLGYCDDVPSVLKRMSVFVLPTRSEGLGLSVLEAMAMGVPVVATAVGGVPELVSHQHTGLLVGTEDFGAVARSVRRLLRDRELAEALRGAAFYQVAREFSTQRMIDRTLDVYRRVIHG